LGRRAGASGQRQAALAKCNEALKDAPAWQALHQARNETAKHVS